MKKLKKILLINWLYFQKQLIEVEDINFLTGKNGAGKSTIIDALQIVFLGELNERNFNKAANESSQRTLEGYLRADIDENSPYSRKGKDFSSYIACEFYDDQSNTSFVLGVVFDCRNDGGRQSRFFSYNGTIPDHCFVLGGQAMDIVTLRQYLKGISDARAEFYLTNKEYRSAMLAKWNVHTEQVCRMLKKAVSFRPIVDIQQFITENICDIPDKPDIESMQQNIRDYKRDEQLAQLQEEKLTALKEIGKSYRESQQALERYRLHDFLSLWASKEELGSKIEKLRLDEQSCQQRIVKIDERCAQIAEDIASKRQRCDELKASCAQNEVFQEETRLRGQKQAVINEQSNLSKRLDDTALEIKREAHWISTLCGKIDEWSETEYLSELKHRSADIQAAATPLDSCSAETFGGPFILFEQAHAAFEGLRKSISDSFYAVDQLLSDARGRADEKQSALDGLRRNVKDYPSGLRALQGRLKNELIKQTKQNISVDILADVLEIAVGEEAWRGAVEGYLNTQKFYLLVPPDVYQTALNLFDQMKHEFGNRSFGLVDVGKLREREKVIVQDNSLAKKIETDNPLARDYIDYLLGRVICCSNVSELRNYRTAITSEGMLYQGFVARSLRKDQMRNAFIGQKAIALRIEQLQAELASIQEDILVLEPVYDDLMDRQGHDYLFTRHFLEHDVAQACGDYIRKLELARELEAIEDQLSRLDMFWLNDMRQKISELESSLIALEGERGALLEERGQHQNQIHTLECDTLPTLYQDMDGKEETVHERFSEQYIQAVGIPRYQQELARLKRASVIAKNFGEHLQQTINEERAARSRLFNARAEYVQRFQPCSFRADAEDNDEFFAEEKKLEESELPKYREKIRQARDSAMEQFQNDFLAKLKSSIEQVQDQVRNLNKALRQAQFGTDRYQFRADRNPDYAEFYDMIMAPELMEGEGGLFAMPFQQKYGKLIEDLFGRLAASDDTYLNARKQSELQQNIERYTDFRTYLKFDLETMDQNGNRQLLSQTLNAKSGGETQTPFYVAVVASFVQLYQVNNHSGVMNNTVRLVIFDEAFNKMDSDRIIESVRLLRRMHLQAIICTPPDKLPDIMPLADKALLVRKEKYRMQVLPWSKKVPEQWNDSSS